MNATRDMAGEEHEMALSAEALPWLGVGAARARGRWGAAVGG